MTEKAIKGKKQTTILFACVLLISLYTIVFYQMRLETIDFLKLVQQGIRLGFTILLIYLILKGKEWAKVLMGILFFLAVIMSFISFFTLSGLINKVSSLVMIIVYCLTIYHLAASENFKEYFEYLKSKN